MSGVKLEGDRWTDALFYRAAPGNVLVVAALPTQQIPPEVSGQPSGDLRPPPVPMPEEAGVVETPKTAPAPAVAPPQKVTAPTAPLPGEETPTVVEPPKATTQS